MAGTALDIHEAFASNLAFEKQILWDAYTTEQFFLFEEKLKALYRSSNSEDPKEIKRMEKIRAEIYTSTISQSKYTNKNLLATFILVTVAEGTTYRQVQNATKFSVHLVVRTRKCIKRDDSTNCCMVFIDENGCVYKNWKHFMDTNLLPAGVALAPVNGVYEYENDKLIMDFWETPANGLASKVVETADVAAGVGGLAAAGVTLSALALPVAAPLLAGAGVVCLGAGIYSAVRSGWQLWSRSDHEQSIGITNQQARGCWFGVASGALAVSSSLATRSLAQMAAAGREISLVRETVVNGMNISTMLLSGTGVANGILDLILKSDDEDVSALDLLQVAASLAIFTHSAYNFRLASTIVNNARNTRVNNYRSELSNRQRKMFDKMTKETIRTQGATKGKMDVIRLINEVPDKQYLNDLNRINRDLNRNGVRFSAGQDGNILLNDDVSVRAGVLRDSVQHGRGENILGRVARPIPQSHTTIPNQETVNLLTTQAFSENSGNLISYCNKFLNVAQKLILNFDSFQNCVRELIRTVGSEITTFLIRKATDFVEQFRTQVENFLRATLYLDNVLWDLYKVCENKLTTITITSIEENINAVFKALMHKYEGMSFRSTTAESVLCTVCGGYYQICSIE